VTPRILALDLSLTKSGVCIDSGQTTIISSGSLRGPERLSMITNEVRSLVAVVDADIIVIEGYSFGSQGRATFSIGELGGCVRLLFWRMGVPYVEVPPSCLKKWATGKGNANKDAMIAEAVRRFGFPGSDNNEVDAYLLWAMARHAYGSPVAKTTVAQAGALESVTWPRWKDDE